MEGMAGMEKEQNELSLYINNSNMNNLKLASYKDDIVMKGSAQSGVISVQLICLVKIRIRNSPTYSSIGTRKNNHISTGTFNMDNIGEVHDVQNIPTQEFVYRSNLLP